MAREQPDRELSAKINNPALPTSAKLQAMLDAGTPTGKQQEYSGWGTSVPVPGAKGMLEAERNGRRIRLLLWLEDVTTVRGDETSGLTVEAPTGTLVIPPTGLIYQPKPDGIRDHEEQEQARLAAPPPPSAPPTFAELLDPSLAPENQKSPVTIFGRVDSPLLPDTSPTARRGESTYQRYMVSGSEGKMHVWEGEALAYMLLVPKDGSVRLPSIKSGNYIQATGTLDVLETPTGNGSMLIERRLKATEVKKLR